MQTESLPKNSGVPTKSLAEWLPELNELLSQDVLASARKKPRNAVAAAGAAPQNTEKFRPMSMAEIKADIDALTGRSSKKPPPQSSVSASINKRWNSSVKVDKRVSHTSNGQMHNNPVRKVLNFQPKMQFTTYTRTTMSATTPKFPKPESRAKKSIHIKAKQNPMPRISGVYKIPETPVETNKPVRRITMAAKESRGRVGKENTAPKPAPPKPRVSVVRKQFLSPLPLRRKPVPDTPLTNDSWKSSCDASFLQKEREIDIEQRVTEEATANNLQNATPPVSTPFKEYRNVQDFFNNSSDMENTTLVDNTVACFEKTADNIKDDSVIVSLCDMFNKATVTHTNTENPKTELDILVEIKRETENNIKSQFKLLKYINKLIKKKVSASTVKTLIQQVNVSNVLMVSNETSPVRASVIKSPQNKTPKRSPSYVIPRRTPCMRKKVFYKSMPEMREKVTPVKVDDGKALTMYMQMKQQMNFLNTPVVKQSKSAIPDTPALTSKNLQKQLNKLFGS